ncbi:MAG: helix-turn-helix transcriptional regulator [Candidatus Cloacimonetes bacterium]|nr:helix-turn-helix transcriptional regulator [Candidatus Cloacimonadota bacterium]
MKQEFREFISGFGEDTVDEIGAYGLQLQFLEEVKYRMNFLGINQKELANKMNINPSFLSNAFNGNKLLNLKHIAKLERILNIDANISFKPSENVEKNSTVTDIYSASGNAEEYCKYVKSYQDIDQKLKNLSKSKISTKQDPAAA